MCIKDYETEIGGQGPVSAVEVLKKNIRRKVINFKFLISKVTSTKSVRTSSNYIIHIT
jgi:hypothetical protein